MRKQIAILAIIAFVIGMVFTNSKSRDRLLAMQYDLFHDNPAVTNRESVDSILYSLTEKKYGDLDERYLAWSRSDEPKYRKILRGSVYREIKREDFYRRIAGNFRIRDFVCRDSVYRRCLFDADHKFYWLIDQELLYAVIELQKELDRRGFSRHSFRIRNGHRHPRKNEAVNGAGLSRHINGQAIDMVIGDVDGDGAYSSEDKDIILEIVDKAVIGDRGGVGRYPGSRTVHIDVRGFRARWDSY